MDAWFPRLSADGRHVVSGSVRLTIDDVDVAAGAAPQWAGSRILFTRQPDGAFCEWGKAEPIRAQGFNFFDVAEDGRWVGYRADPPRLIWFDNVEWPGWADGDISNTRWAARVQATGALFAGTGNGQNGKLIAEKDATDVRIEDDVLVWRVAGRIYAQRHVAMSIEDWTIDGVQHFFPIPVRVNGKDYVLTHTEDERLLLYEGKKDQTHGHVVATGVTDFPDGKAIDATHVRVRWSVKGEPRERIIDITQPTVDLRRRPPVLDTSGAVLNLWEYIIPEPGMFPRIQAEPRGHAMDCKFDGRNFWLMPFGEPDHWVRWIFEPGSGPTGGKMTIREDHSRDGQSSGDWSATHGHWLDQFMAPRDFGGHVIDGSANCLVRYDPEGCRILDVHRQPFRNYLYQHWLGVDCGPDLGVRDVIITCTDPGDDKDTKEYAFWAKGAGNYRFQTIKQPAETLLFEKWFELFGGPHLEPTQGCWQPKHLNLTPENWQGTPPEEHMTENDIRKVSTPVPPDIFIGALLRFRNEVLLDRDKIGDDSMTAGALMYFVPNYNAAIVELLARQGLPSGSPEQVFVKWAGMSGVGLQRAADHYNREQKGDTGGGGGDTDFPTNPLDRIDGQLEIEPGGGFVVNGRPVLPTLCHYGDALSKWMRDRGHVERNLDLITEAGYHGIRYWTVLDGDWWNGRHVGERFQGNYWEQHRDFLLALKARGLVAQISQGSLTRDAVPDRSGFANRLADVLTDVGTEVCALFEGVNEARDTGEPDAGRLAEFVNVFKSRLSWVLCGLSAYTGTEDVDILNDFSRPPADLFVVHPYRGGHNHDKTRHLMSLRYEGKPKKRIGWNGEGPGPGNRVSAIDNRDAMTAATMCGLAAMSFMMRMAYVYFCGVGVISDDGGSQTFDQMPGFFEVPKARTVVPTDVMRYSGPIFHGGETWRNDRTFAARGDVRADHVVHHDGRRVIGIYGPGDLNVPQDRPFNIAADERWGNEFRLVVGRAA